MCNLLNSFWGLMFVIFFLVSIFVFKIYVVYFALIFGLIFLSVWICKVAGKYISKIFYGG
jgi:hypothetical protein